MATYILLMKYTDEGVKNIKDVPRRIQQANEGGERMGGKIIGLYPVMGEYDYVCIAEFENDETMMTYSLVLNSIGNVRTTTLKAFTTEWLIDLAKKLP